MVVYKGTEELELVEDNIPGKGPRGKGGLIGPTNQARSETEKPHKSLDIRQDKRTLTRSAKNSEKVKGRHSQPYPRSQDLVLVLKSAIRMEKAKNQRL